MKNCVRILMIGDVSGSAGMGALFLGLSSLVRDEKIDFVIVNGENAAGGDGGAKKNARRSAAAVHAGHCVLETVGEEVACLL